MTTLWIEQHVKRNMNVPNDYTMHGWINAISTLLAK